MHFYGSGFELGWTVLVLSAAASIPVCLNNVVGSAIASTGAMWWGFLFNGLWAIAFLGGAVQLIPRLNANGLALAVLISYVAHSVWQGLFLYRVLGKNR
jgi:O-antigen/teichoic acid export membrane protein